jgi:hypothetical protein
MFDAAQRLQMHPAHKAGADHRRADAIHLKPTMPRRAFP